MTVYLSFTSKYGSIPSFSQKVAIGVYAGLVGAFVGCPSEIILVRMMADGPVDPYRRYRGLFDAFTKLVLPFLLLALVYMFSAIRILAVRIL